MQREDQNGGRPGIEATLRVSISLCIALVCPHRFYEVKLLTGGMMRMGWATPSYHAGQQLGADENSYAFDGFLVREVPSSTHHFSTHPLPLSPSLFSHPLTLSPYRHASGTMGQKAMVGGGILVIL